MRLDTFFTQTTASSARNMSSVESSALFSRWPRYFTVLPCSLCTAKLVTVQPHAPQLSSAALLAFKFYIVRLQPLETQRSFSTLARNGVRWTLPNILLSPKSLVNNSFYVLWWACGFAGGTFSKSEIGLFRWRSCWHWSWSQRFWVHFWLKCVHSLSWSLEMISASWFMNSLNVRRRFTLPALLRCRGRHL